MLLERASSLAALLGAALALGTALAEGGALPLLATSAVAGALLGGLLVGASGERGPRAHARLPHLHWPSWADLEVGRPSLFVLWPILLTTHPLALALLSALALTLFVLRARRDTMRPPHDRRGRGELDLYAAGLLLLALVVGAHYLVIGWGAAGSFDNDAAYYLGVARYLAAHGRLEEPIIWHFLSPPGAIVHSAFDYWQGLTSIVLAIPLAIFGRTHLVASLTMAGLSGLGVLLFTHLVVVAKPLASRAGQLVAVLAFAYSPAMATFRFDTESSVVFQLGLIGALLAIAYERLALAALLSFLVFLARADGVVTVAIVWLFLLVRLARARHTPAGQRAARGTLLVMLGAVGLTLASNLARFGTPTPPGARLAPFLLEYGQIYRLDPRRSPGTLGELIHARLHASVLRAAIDQVVAAFTHITYVLSPTILAAALGIGLLVLARPRTDRAGLHRLTLALVLLGAPLIAWASPVVFAPWRTLHGLLPAMVLAAVLSAELPVRALSDALAKRRPELSRRLFALGTSLLLLPGLGWTHAYAPVQAIHADYEAELRSLDPILEGANVATTSPWWVIANTESPALLLPFQDEATTARLLHAYDVEYVLFSRGDVESFGADAWSVWMPYRDGRVSTLGPYHLSLVHRGPHVTLYRLERDRLEQDRP